MWLQAVKIIREIIHSRSGNVATTLPINGTVIQFLLTERKRLLLNMVAKFMQLAPGQEWCHPQVFNMQTAVWITVCVCVYVCVCVCVRVYVVYEDTNLYNDMGMTEVLQFEGVLWGHCLCPRNSKGLKNILNGVFLKI